MDSLIDRFVISAREVAASVEIIRADPIALSEALVREVGHENVLLSEPADIDPALFSRFRQNKNVVVTPDREMFQNIGIGITDAFCAIASTGSVCVPVVSNLSFPASALTRKHIVVVDGKNILPRPRDIFSEKYLGGVGLKKSFSIITGPSATADMGPLVRGVHGPGKVHIIILEHGDEKH